MSAGNGRIRLGVSHLVWGFDLSMFDRFKVFVDEAAGIGYQGIVAFDTTVMPWLGRPGEFKAVLDQRNLQLVGVILRPGIDFTFTHRLCKFIAEAGGEILIMSGPCGTEAEWSIVLPALQRHAEAAHPNAQTARYRPTHAAEAARFGAPASVAPVSRENAEAGSFGYGAC